MEKSIYVLDVMTLINSYFPHLLNLMELLCKLGPALADLLNINCAISTRKDGDKNR